jgi:hypothetical protein
VSEVAPAAEAAETTEDPFHGIWTVHTVESWARAVIDDMVQELARDPNLGSVEFGAVWRCRRYEDGSFGAAIQIRGKDTTYSVHRVKVG